MNEINIGKATELTSPNPLVLVCTEKPDGSMNVTPVSFVSYLSFNPPMIGFAMGKAAYTGERVRETGKAILSVPGKSLSDVVMSCGSSSGNQTDKVGKFNIKLAEVAGSSIKIPADSKLAFVVTLSQTVEVGDHYLYICNVEKMYGDEAREALFAWNGYSKVVPAQEK